MHVVQALATLSIGGSELVVAETCEYLASRGCKVTVLSGDGPLNTRISASGADLLPWPVGKKRLSTLRYIQRFRQWLSEHRPDLVHAHSRLPAWICWRAIRGLPASRRPVFVTSMHGHYSVSKYSSVMAKGDRVIAVSEAIREYTLFNYAAGADRVITVHGGADRGAFPFAYRPSEAWRQAAEKEFLEIEGKRLLCLPGRLSRYKGHAEFINLVAALAGDCPDIHGVIVGACRPGSRYMDELAGLAHASGIEDRITFTGVRLDMREWLAASELVFNLCSDPPEAFGRTVLESLCLGRPVLGWDHGGVAEILREMYPAGAVTPDDVSALLEKTKLFLKGAPSVMQSDAFLLEDSMQQSYDVYRSLLLPGAAASEPQCSY